MWKPGLVIFLICTLLVTIGLIIYLKSNNPKISAKAKLVNNLIGLELRVSGVSNCGLRVGI